MEIVEIQSVPPLRIHEIQTFARWSSYNAFLSIDIRTSLKSALQPKWVSQSYKYLYLGLGEGYHNPHPKITSTLAHFLHLIFAGPVVWLGHSVTCSNLFFLSEPTNSYLGFGYARRFSKRSSNVWYFLFDFEKLDIWLMRFFS